MQCPVFMRSRRNPRLAENRASYLPYGNYSQGGVFAQSFCRVKHCVLIFAFSAGLLFFPPLRQCGYHNNYNSQTYCYCGYHNNYNSQTYCYLYPDCFFGSGSRNFLRWDYLCCYRMRCGLDLERPGYLRSCRKRTLYVPWLSPRERTGAASPILKSKSPVVLAVLAFDTQFRGRRPDAVAG